MMSLYISLDDTDTDKQIKAQRRSQMACTISLGLCLGPSGTCQSMRIPVKPKQSACARGRSLRGCYTAREQTAAYWVSRYYPRTATDTVHFHNVSTERQHEKASLMRFGLKWQSDRGIKRAEIRAETWLRRRCKDTRGGTSKTPALHNNLRGEENVSGIVFDST